MSVTVFPYSKPGKESPADSRFGDCCGMRPLIITWPKKDFIGVVCQSPTCPNSEGVLACDVDIVEKWQRFRVQIPTKEASADE